MNQQLVSKWLWFQEIDHPERIPPVEAETIPQVKPQITQNMVNIIRNANHKQALNKRPKPKVIQVHHKTTVVIFLHQTDVVQLMSLQKQFTVKYFSQRPTGYFATDSIGVQRALQKIVGIPRTKTSTCKKLHAHTRESPSL